MDPRATRFINARNIEALLKELSPPLGVKGLAYDQGLKKEMQRIVLTSKIPCHPGGFVQFHETLHGLAARAAFAPLDGEEDDEDDMRQEEMEIELIKLMPSLAYRNVMGPTAYDAGHFMAAMYVQSAIRGFLARHQPPAPPAPPPEPEVPVSGSRRILNGITGLMRSFSQKLDTLGLSVSRRMGSMRVSGGGNGERTSSIGGDQGMPADLQRRMNESIRRGGSFAMWGGGEDLIGGLLPRQQSKNGDDNDESRSMAGGGQRR